MFSAIGTKSSQLSILILEQSISAAARALAKDMLTYFMNYRVQWIFSTSSNFDATV
jgi:hypothetical protein